MVFGPRHSREGARAAIRFPTHLAAADNSVAPMLDYGFVGFQHGRYTLQAKIRSSPPSAIASNRCNACNSESSDLQPVMPVTGVAGVTGFLAACSLRSRRCAAPKGVVYGR